MLAAGERFRRDGACIVPGLLDDRDVEQLRRLAQPLLFVGGKALPGARQVLRRAPAIGAMLARTAFSRLLRALCGERAQIVRAILFDKRPDANWLVPWHQDATIAVRERAERPGFGPWSIKDGETHCRPPVPILDRIVVVRLHLDDCGPDCGPLRLVPGSHRAGLMDARGIDQAVALGPVLECCTSAGGAVIMHPHTLHASAKSRSLRRRRVLHLECTDATLPEGLSWAEAVSV